MRSHGTRRLAGLWIAGLFGLLSLSPTLFADSASAPILIGVSRSESGPLADASTLLHRGLDLWIQDLEQRGALLNRQVRLKVVNDGSDPSRAAAGYRQLYDDGVRLFVSPYASDLTLKVQDALGNRDYAMVSVASEPAIWARTDPRVFGLYTPADDNMVPALAIAQERGYRRIAIAYLTGAFPASVAHGAVAEAERLGLEPLVPIEYGKGADYDALAARIKALNPDVLLVGSYLDDAIALSQAAVRVRLKPKLVAFSGGPALRDYGTALGSNQIDGVLSTVQWMRSVRFPGAFDFGFRYREQHGIYPSYDAAGGYAALQVLEAAIRLAGSAEAATVRQQLQRMKFRSILGHYRVDNRGRQIAKETYLVQWQGDHISLVWPEDLSRWELKLPFAGFGSPAP